MHPWWKCCLALVSLKSAWISPSWTSWHFVWTACSTDMRFLSNFVIVAFSSTLLLRSVCITVSCTFFTADLFLPCQLSLCVSLRCSAHRRQDTGLFLGSHYITRHYSQLPQTAGWIYVCTVHRFNNGAFTCVRWTTVIMNHLPLRSRGNVVHDCVLF